MRRPHFIGGVGILVLVLLLAIQGTFGARGSAAQTGPGIPVYLFFVANPGDTCWDLAEKYGGGWIHCEEMLRVNEDVSFSQNGDPIIVAGRAYWVHPRWVQNFLALNQGEHQLFRASAEQTGIGPVAVLPPGEGVQTAVIGGGGDTSSAYLIFGVFAGATIVLLAGACVVLYRRRSLPTLDLPTLLQWTRRSKQEIRS